jgi:hypothetical protein
VDKKPDSAFKVGGQETWTSIKGTRRWKKKPYPVFKVAGRKTPVQYSKQVDRKPSKVLKVDRKPGTVLKVGGQETWNSTKVGGQETWNSTKVQ